MLIISIYGKYVFNIPIVSYLKQFYNYVLYFVKQINRGINELHIDYVLIKQK